MCLAVVRVAFFSFFFVQAFTILVRFTTALALSEQGIHAERKSEGKVEGGHSQQVKVGLLHVCVAFFFRSPFSHSFIVHITDFVFSSLPSKVAFFFLQPLSVFCSVSRRNFLKKTGENQHNCTDRAHGGGRSAKNRCCGKKTQHSNSFTIKTIFSIIRNFW